MLRYALAALAALTILVAGAAQAAYIVVDRTDTLDAPGVPGCSLLRAIRLVNAGTDLYAAHHECTFAGTLGDNDQIAFLIGGATQTVTISADGASTFNLPPIVKAVSIDGKAG